MQYADIQQNLEDLERYIPNKDRMQYLTFNKARIESAFADRIFVAYTFEHGQPRVLGTYQVTMFGGDVFQGFVMILEGDAGEEQEIGHVPERLFDTDIFVHIPPRNVVTSGLKLETNNRSYTFGLRIVTYNSSASRTEGKHYLDTLNQFRTAFPDYDLSPYNL